MQLCFNKFEIYQILRLILANYYFELKYSKLWSFKGSDIKIIIYF